MKQITERGTKMIVERTTTEKTDKRKIAEYAVKAVALCMNERAVKVKYLGGGSFGRAVRVRLGNGKDIVIKFLLANGMMEKEAHDLVLLRKNCPTKLPSVIFTRKSDSALPYDCYGMELIEGKSAFWAFGMLFLSKRRRLRFAEQVTDALHALHECKADKFGDTMHPDCESWSDVYRPFAKQVLEKAEEYYANGELSEKVITAMRAAWAKFDVIFSEKVTDACLIHGDLNIANIMVGKGYEITGFIDPLNSMYADREYDLFQFDNLTGKRFALRETYVRKFGGSKRIMQKLAFYGLWNEVFCFIKSGVLVGLIMNPLVKNMRKRLAEL